MWVKIQDTQKNKITNIIILTIKIAQAPKNVALGKKTPNLYF